MSSAYSMITYCWPARVYQASHSLGTNWMQYILQPVTNVAPINYCSLQTYSVKRS